MKATLVLRRREERYAFVSMERLIEDFIADIERLGGGHGQ